MKVSRAGGIAAVVLAALALWPLTARAGCEDDLVAARAVNRNALASAESYAAFLIEQNRLLEARVKSLEAELAKLKATPKDEKK